MRRFTGALLIMALVLAACGGRDPEPPADGNDLAALQETDAPEATDKSDDAGGDAGSKKPPRKSDGGKDKGSGGGEGSSGEGSGATKPKQPGSNTGGSGGGNKAPQPGGPTAAVPIPGGSYSYDTDGASSVSGNTRRLPKKTTLTARAARGEEQIQVRDLRDSDGNGTVVETHLLYRKEGVYLTYVKITSTFQGGFTDVRELQPAKAQLIAPTGAEPGASVSFSMEGSGTRADVDVKAKRFEQVTIGDSTVNALVVDSRIVFSGALEGEQNSTTWFWGKHVMAVREQVTTDVTNGPIRAQSQYQAILTRLP